MVKNANKAKSVFKYYNKKRRVLLAVQMDGCSKTIYRPVLSTGPVLDRNSVINKSKR